MKKILMVLAAVLLMIMANYSGVCAETVDAAAGYTISGKVKFGSIGLAGVTITIDGDAAGSAITDANGNYRFRRMANGNYTLTPSKAGFTFNPVLRTITVDNADIPGQNYTATMPSVSLDSPFGIHPAAGGSDYAYAKDLGVKWNREGQYFIWEWIDYGRTGKYSFTQANTSTLGIFNYDKNRINLNSVDIEMIVNICPFYMGGEFQSDSEKAIYQDFIEKTVERYDGDEDLGCTLGSPDCYIEGDNQYPRNDLITKFRANPIKHWQLCNQLYDTCNYDCDNTYAKKYAEALQLTYEAIKKADSSANVLMAGDSEQQLCAAVYKELGGKYVDIIDFHRFGKYNWYNSKNDLNFVKENLQSSGFDTSKLRFWITETGTYSGIPTKVSRYGYQSEKQQAGGLLKAYVSALANGIEKIFWAWGIVEGFEKDCSFFDYTGLMYDGCDCVNGTYTCGTNIGYDKGNGVKKLSYYTYKKMTETLDGSDWKNVATIQESSGVYIYQFTKNGNLIWIAWNDNTNSQTISLDVGTINTVKIVEAIPKYVSGSEVTDYNSAFNSESKTAQNGKIILMLNDVPVFVGESI